jgi:hypothetical protein
MRKLAKGKGPAILTWKSVLKDTAGSSPGPLRIKRVNKPPVLKPYAIFEEDEEPLPPQGPTIASLNNKIIKLCEDVRILKSQVADSEIKIRDLGYKNNVFRFSFGEGF